MQENRKEERKKEKKTTNDEYKQPFLDREK